MNKPMPYIDKDENEFIITRKNEKLDLPKLTVDSQLCTKKLQNSNSCPNIESSAKSVIIGISNPSDQELMIIADQLGITEENFHLLEYLFEIVTEIKFDNSNLKFRTLNGNSYWTYGKTAAKIFPFLDDVKEKFEKAIKRDMIAQKKERFYKYNVSSVPDMLQEKGLMDYLNINETHNINELLSKIKDERNKIVDKFIKNKIDLNQIK